MALLSTDPIDWLLDDDGDLVVQPDISLTSGIAGVVQSCRIAVQMIRGEWFFDEAEGIPLFERPGVPANDALFGQAFNELKVLAAYREALLSVPQTISILSLQCSLSRATRELTVSWSVRTVFGDSAIQTTGVA